MQAYTNFAKVYDIFMDNIPYEEWAEYLDEILKEYHIPAAPLRRTAGAGFRLRYGDIDGTARPGRF